MLISLLTPETLAQIQAGAIAVLIVIVFVGSVLFIRQLHSLRQALVGLSTTHQQTQDLIEQRHTSSQEQIQQLQIAQASTQATVIATQQEMQHLMRDLTTLQRDAQNLMRELKTQQNSTQAFMADWKKDTNQLSRALRTSYQQGIWGEQELERVVELAGMQRS